MGCSGTKKPSEVLRSRADKPNELALVHFYSGKFSPNITPDPHVLASA